MKQLYELVDKAWQWIAERIFVRFDFDLPLDLIKSKAADGNVSFCLTQGGFIEWLILSSWTRKQGLDAILVANRMSILLFAKPLFFFQVLFRRKSYADLFLSERSGPRILFCPSKDRKRPFSSTPAEKLLTQLYLSFKKQDNLGAHHFIPVLLLWRKYGRGGGQGSAAELFFGRSSRPNWIGKIWFLFRKRRDSTIRALTPFRLVDLERSELDPSESEESSRIARIARRRILVDVHQETRVILGPRYDSPHLVKELLIRDPEIESLVTELAKKTGKTEKKLLQIAYNNFTEIIATYKHRTIAFLHFFLTYLFTKIFDRVKYDKEELQEVRNQLKSKPVVFVACHRSHFDYLVMPYVLYSNDLSTPHIAAGINLSFWPMGPILRSAGAFFIRRSFKGDDLYNLCLKKYIQHLLRNRIPYKFFIEGTRSRSGKMLAPAYGLLKSTLDACEKHTVGDLSLVPVSIAYDEVPEERSYTSEIEGAKKEKESAGLLLRSGSIIKRKMGRVYLTFGQALSVKTLFENGERDNLDATRILQKTAFQLSKNICNVTPITMRAIVSTVALNHSSRELPLDSILRLSELLIRYVEYSKHRLSSPRLNLRRLGIEQAVNALCKKGALESNSTRRPKTYFCPGSKRTLLTYYKNTAMHCTVLPAIGIVAIADSGSKEGENLEAIQKSALELRNLLKFEFFFSPTNEFILELKQCLQFFKKESFERSDLSIFSEGIGYLLESYLLCLEAIEEVASGEGIEKKELIGKIAKYTIRKKEKVGIRFPEAISVQNFSNCLSLLENIGGITLQREKNQTFVTIASKREPMKALKRRLQLFLDAIDGTSNSVKFAEAVSSLIEAPS